MSHSQGPYFRVEPHEVERAVCPCCAEDVGLRGFVYGEGDGAALPCAVYGVVFVGLGQRVMARLWIVTGAWDAAATPDQRVGAGFVVTPPAQAGGEHLCVTDVSDASLFHDLRDLALPLAGIHHQPLLTCLARVILKHDPRLAVLQSRTRHTTKPRVFQAAGSAPG